MASSHGARFGLGPRGRSHNVHLTSASGANLFPSGANESSLPLSGREGRITIVSAATIPDFAQHNESIETRQNISTITIWLCQMEGEARNKQVRTTKFQQFMFGPFFVEGQRLDLHSQAQISLLS